MNYKKEILRLMRQVDREKHERFLRAIYISLKEFVREEVAA